MKEQNKLHFSEYDFGGFYDLELSWDDAKLSTSYFIPKEAEETYYLSKEKERAEAARIGDSYTHPNQFYIKCKSRTIYWENLETISYYEMIEPNYYLFRILLKTGEIGEEILITGKTNENSVRSETVKHDSPDILDTMLIGDRPVTREERYLKEMYRTLLDTLIPFGTDKILAGYKRRLKSNERIELGKLNIEREGVVLNQKKGLFRRGNCLVSWENIVYSIREGNLYLKDVTDARTNLEIERDSLVNQGAIEALIGLGKAGELG